MTSRTQQSGGGEGGAEDAGSSNAGPPEFRRVTTIRNQLGLHARAAAKFVKLAGDFNAEVTVSKGGQTVSGVSIMGLMMLAAGIHREVELTASGAEAAEAIEALCALIEDKFDED